MTGYINKNDLETKSEHPIISGEKCEKSVKMAEKGIKISIVLSTYNRAHTLKATIDSILAQSYEMFELLIVDDGSTDQTKELLETYKDQRIRTFYLEENQYYCAAANYGIAQAKGEYIAFATSDDPWEPRKLKMQMEYLEARPECGACFTFSDVIDEEGNPAQDQFEMISGLLMRNYYTRKEWIQQFIFDGNCLCHPSSVIRKEVLDEVGGYHLFYCQSADMELWLRIVRRYPIHVIEENLVHYRCYRNPNAQISGAEELKAARFLNEHMIIRRNFINHLSDEEMIEFFGDCFQNQNAAEHLELEIEKAFLLMGCAKGLPDFRILGIEKFEELLQIPEAVKLLREKYHVRPQEIYQWNLGHYYVDFGIHVRMDKQDRKTLLQKETIYKSELYIEALQKYRDALTDRICQYQKDTGRLKDRLEETQLQADKLEEQWMEAERQLQISRHMQKEKEEELESTKRLLKESLLQKLALEEKIERKGTVL